MPGGHAHCSLSFTLKSNLEVDRRGFIEAGRDVEGGVSWRILIKVVDVVLVDQHTLWTWGQRINQEMTE